MIIVSYLGLFVLLIELITMFVCKIVNHLTKFLPLFHKCIVILYHSFVYLYPDEILDRKVVVAIDFCIPGMQPAFVP